MKSTRIEDRGQHMVRSQKYPFKLILKEAGPFRSSKDIG